MAVGEEGNLFETTLVHKLLVWHQALLASLSKDLLDSVQGVISMTRQSLLSELDLGELRGMRRWRKLLVSKEEPPVPTIQRGFERRETSSIHRLLSSVPYECICVERITFSCSSVANIRITSKK